MSRKSAISYLRPAKAIQPSVFYTSALSTQSPQNIPTPESGVLRPVRYKSTYSRHLSLRIESEDESSMSQDVQSPYAEQSSLTTSTEQDKDGARPTRLRTGPHTHRFAKTHSGRLLAKSVIRHSPLSARERILGSKAVSQSVPVLSKLEINTVIDVQSLRQGKASSPFAAKYIMGAMLDFGTYAKVSRCTRRSDGSVFAVKEAHVFGPYKEQLLHSCDILVSVDHPMLSKVVDYIYDSTEEKVYVISKLYTYGSLYAKLKADRKNYTTCFPDERVIWDISAQVVDALEFLHNPERNRIGIIVHRDISPKNILVSNAATKQVIMILSILAVELVGGAKTVQLVGCPTYAAPEVLRGAEYDEKADIWSLGCSLYEICKGYRLFYSTELSDILKMQYSCPTINLEMYSEELQNFIKAMIVINPDSRVTASEAAKHPRIVEARKRVESGGSAGYAWFVDRSEEKY